MPARRNRWFSDFALALREKAGTTTVEEAVIHFTNQKLDTFADLKPPIDLSIVASVCGIVPKIAYVSMKEDGRLVYIDNKHHIEVNKKHNSSRQRFTTAHEISHKLLNVKVAEILNRSCENVGLALRKKEEEWLCDFGATQLLLLTPNYITPIVNDLRFSFSAVEEIETSFQVSFEAAVRSSVTNFSLPVAAVFFAPGLTKNQTTKQISKPLSPQFAELVNLQKKLRIVRAYTSPKFTIRLPYNKSVRDDSCIVNAYQRGGSVLKHKEHLFDNESFQFTVEAQKREFYLGGSLTSGVVALLSNPTPQG